ncbi:MBL fold metallo-hydrolase [Salinimicrobium sp. GXAS 041]|uniref:MBL fold metallo-hydrolase n=1 Tax=Salinimicrobium sp. GXAS 041 TaxID=3400806 RepID=UPI003C793C6E
MSEELKKNEDNKFIPMTSVSGGKERALSEDVLYYTNQIVNVIFIGKPNSQDWVLVDAGMPKSAEKIVKVAEDRFGKDRKPSAILLTHGHFDHTGSLIELIKKWEVPVYAHPLEFPYLTGEKAYPEPDASVEGGTLAKISKVYPHEPIDISKTLKELPADQSVPGLPDWKWLHTPGHSPGHVSFFREKDRMLVAGDAFVTVKQDSLYKVLVQKKEIHGPPRYLTTNWSAAWDSVRKLDALHPETAVTGHGTAMEGEELQNGLQYLMENFEELAIPDYGKFVKNKRES